MNLAHRTSMLVKALMLGYTLKCTNNMLLKIDEQGNPWSKIQDEFIEVLFDVDIKFLQTQAAALSEQEYFNVVSFVTNTENNLCV